MDAHLVELDRDHPGFRDPVYRTRRDAIARLAQAHERGKPPPHVDYSPEEDQVWGGALDVLTELHARYACRSYLATWPRLDFTKRRVPQLAEISLRILRPDAVPVDALRRFFRRGAARDVDRVATQARSRLTRGSFA